MSGEIQGSRSWANRRTGVIGALCLLIGGLFGPPIARAGVERMTNVFITNTTQDPVPTVAQGTTQINGTVDVGNLPAKQAVEGTVNVGNLPAKQAVEGTVNVGNLPAAPELRNGFGVISHGNPGQKVVVPAGVVLTDIVVHYGGNGVNSCDTLRIIPIDSGGQQVGFYSSLMTSRVVNGPASAELHLNSGIESTDSRRIAIANGEGSCSFEVFWSGFTA